jgi:L-seryl-tRNA(Ser) seleniumtransferase
MATTDPTARAEAVAAMLDSSEVVAGESLVGGGSAPGAGLPTSLVRWKVGHPDGVAAWLRALDPPIIVRVDDGCVVIDLRTVDPTDDQLVLQCLLESGGPTATDRTP